MPRISRWISDMGSRHRRAWLNCGRDLFNTSITGYQEILTDPSYAGQIINFTFPHVGNVGTNLEDNESTTPAARGLILRAEITPLKLARDKEP